MLRFRNSLLTLCSMILPLGAACAAGPAVTDPSEAGADYELQGEYVGEFENDGGEKRHGVQVIALGDGKFRAVVHLGGLPGDGWRRGDPRMEIDGEARDGAVVFMPEDEGGSGTLGDGVITVRNSGGDEIGELLRVERASPTLGKKAPEGAVVLFDGSTAEHFEGGELVDDDLLAVGCKSKHEFKDFELHLEFRTPFMSAARGQARGNSGVYVQNRYEIQVLDSFGLEGADNECGGIYKLRAPLVNMCLPPLAWQTYDVHFTAAEFNDAGEKTKNARVTLLHNGVTVYDDEELPNLTPGGAPQEAPGVGPLMLQDHGDPVRFRNIWVVEKK